MLYLITRHLHTLTWWIILLSGIWAVVVTWRGMLTGAAWTKRDRLAGLIFSSALATQLIIGLVLYYASYSGGKAVHDYFAGVVVGRERFIAAFFAMMHPVAMFTAVVLGQAGFSVSKRLTDDRSKFRAAALCYTVALAIVLVSVPWPFMPYGAGRMFFQP
jgi:hypothetical protein